MLRRVGQIACTMILLALTGCTGLFGRQGVPADPLFSNGKPTEAKGRTGPPLALPFSEPAVPVNNHIVEPH